MKGYKYRSSDYFDRDFKMLLDNQIYASRFVELNDPFEGICNEQITNELSIIESVLGKHYIEVQKSLVDVRNLKNTLGIYSLSKNYSNQLMWAHYANSHNGYCLEYNISKLKDNYIAPERVFQVDVSYKGQPETLSINDIKKTDKTFLKKLFATKLDKWSYEKEVRLIFDTPDLKKYHPSALTGVYFGVKFSNERKKEMMNALTNRNICFYDMYIGENYNLESKLIKRNKRQLKYKVSSSVYKKLKTNHFPKVENFYVLYKGKVNSKDISCFLKFFREYYSTKDCNIELYDDESILSLLDKRVLTPYEYVKLADHFIVSSRFDAVENLYWYPYRDIKYEKYINEIKNTPAHNIELSKKPNKKVFF